ncbi:MAG: ribose-phosphate pyrophosphokinase, partial [Proteobacteria bacterium]|nr:ribose-phosphate pyrophosphokinase [Pseudomonadota bacterium]
TIPLSDEAKKAKNIRVVSVAPLLAEAIKRITSETSVSSLFD